MELDNHISTEVVCCFSFYWVCSEYIYIFFFLCESEEFIVSVLGCLLVRETLCERGDESSNAEESQLDFMSRETPAHIHTNKHPNTQAAPRCSCCTQGHDEVFDLVSKKMTVWLIQTCTHSSAVSHTHTANIDSYECIKTYTHTHTNRLSRSVFQQQEIETRQSPQLRREKKKKTSTGGFHGNCLPFSSGGGQATSVRVRPTFKVAHGQGGREFKVVWSVNPTDFYASRMRRVVRGNGGVAQAVWANSRAEQR